MLRSMILLQLLVQLPKVGTKVLSEVGWKLAIVNSDVLGSARSCRLSQAELG